MSALHDGFHGHGCRDGHSSAGTYDLLWARPRLAYVLVPGRPPKLHGS